MRWMAILHGRVALSLAAASGVHTAEDALKMVSAGADVTQLCSALLEDGPGQLARIKMGMNAGLEEYGHGSLSELKGRVSQRLTADPGA